MDYAGTALRPVGAGTDARGASAIGRHARLELTFERRGGRTVLTSAYAEPPFRVGQTFPEGDGLHMIMASSAPGVFGGDVLHQVIRVEPGACVRLTSQSAVQAHPAADGASASIATRCEVAGGARLHCHWDPLIPFDGAALAQRIELRVADGGQLVWSDALMGGRLARGECWRFASLAHEVRLTRGDTLAYLERYRLTPAAGALVRPWAAGRAGYVGTAIAVGRETSHDEAAAVQEELARMPGVRGAVDRLAADFAIVRLLGEDGVGFRDARARVSAFFATVRVE